MNYPPVSIVVAAYNAQDTLGACIESLLNLDYPEKEIIVVNDGSVDGTEAIIRNYPVVLISQEKKGASAARNIGLRKAENEIIAYTDSDCEVSRSWLKNLVKHFEDRGVGVVTGKTIFRTDRSCTSYVRSLDIEERNAMRRRYTSLANGPNSAFRRDLLSSIGGFNPRWYHAEDTEVSYRVLGRGYKIVYEPKAVVYHAPENNWRDFLRKRFRDAKAFTRLLYSHPKKAIEDDFVTPNMKLQPPLFAVVLFLPILVLLELLFLWALLIMLGIALNIPFSYRTYKKSNRVSFFIIGLALTTARGFCWGFGLIIGGLQNLYARATGG
jgi:cellulose synthase/poly-beta-1,6-N-acetylglucosamine synthase-like glycosyltransferase